jgi:hypothetical protein
MICCIIHDSKFNNSKSELTLTVEPKDGIPTEDGFIFLPPGFIHLDCSIHRVSKKRASPFYLVSVIIFNADLDQIKKMQERIRLEKPTAGFSIEINKYLQTPILKRLNTFKQLVQSTSPDCIKELILENIRLGSILVPHPPQQALSLSFFGGHPIIGSSFIYPKDKNGEYPIFLCQIHLKDVNQWLECSKEFKKDGVLLLFGVIKKEDSLTYLTDLFVQFSEDLASPIPHAIPEELSQYGALKQNDMMLFENVCIPPFESSLLPYEQMNDDETQYYFNLESLVSLGEILIDGLKFLGHPNQVQTCLLLEATLKVNHKGWYDPNYDSKDTDALEQVLLEQVELCKDWRLLFEIDLMNKQFREVSGPEKEINNYLDGCLYLMIKQSDLDNLDFSNTVTIYQAT